MTDERIQAIRRILKNPIADVNGLSDKAREAGKLASLGHTNENIAALMHTDVHNVAYHLRMVADKTGMNKIQLVRRLIDNIENIAWGNNER